MEINKYYRANWEFSNNVCFLGKEIVLLLIKFFFGNSRFFFFPLIVDSKNSCAKFFFKIGKKKYPVIKNDLYTIELFLKLWEFQKFLNLIKIMINFKIWLKNKFFGGIKIQEDEKNKGQIEDLFQLGPILGFWSVKSLSLEFTKFGI